MTLSLPPTCEEPLEKNTKFFLVLKLQQWQWGETETIVAVDLDFDDLVNHLVG
jgi:hypothetical protein